METKIITLARWDTLTQQGCKTKDLFYSGTPLICSPMGHENLTVLTG